MFGKCKYCGEINKNRAIICENCGKQLKDVKKYESLNLEELKKLQSHKIARGSILLLTCIHSLALARVSFFFITLLSLPSIIGFIIAGTLITIGLISPIIGFKILYDLNLVQYSVNLKSESDKKYNEILKELIFTKERKIAFKEKIQEIRSKFKPFEAELNEVKSIFSKRNRTISIFSFIFILAFCTCLPINYITRDVFLSWMTGISFGLIFVYPFFFIGKKWNEQYLEMNFRLLTLSDDPKDKEDFMYYLSLISWKALKKTSILCIIFMILLIVILFMNSAINYDLSIGIGSDGM
ncbi:MAG: zinc ribbon domain-containing protein [Candidatus Lokiarchaeota archaeon]|nr:zinc ribbon domain-containing protein [Candidatus Lokiarchaeota archaeon]